MYECEYVYMYSVCIVCMYAYVFMKYACMMVVMMISVVL